MKTPVAVLIAAVLAGALVVSALVIRDGLLAIAHEVPETLLG